MDQQQTRLGKLPDVYLWLSNISAVSGHFNRIASSVASVTTAHFLSVEPVVGTVPTSTSPRPSHPSRFSVTPEQLNGVLRGAGWGPDIDMRTDEETQVFVQELARAVDAMRSTCDADIGTCDNLIHLDY